MDMEEDYSDIMPGTLLIAQNSYDEIESELRKYSRKNHYYHTLLAVFLEENKVYVTILYRDNFGENIRKKIKEKLLKHSFREEDERDNVLTNGFGVYRTLSYSSPLLFGGETKDLKNERIKVAVEAVRYALRNY